MELAFEIDITSLSQAEMTVLHFAVRQRAVYETAVKDAELRLKWLRGVLFNPLADFTVAKGVNTHGRSPLGLTRNTKFIALDSITVVYRQPAYDEFQVPIEIDLGGTKVQVLMEVPTLTAGNSDNMGAYITVSEESLADSATVADAHQDEFSGGPVRLFEQAILTEENIANWHRLFGDKLSARVEFERTDNDDWKVIAIPYPPDE